jgi:soluble lytic murein transglycosylase
MRKLFLTFCGLLYFFASVSAADKAYMARFNSYLQWRDNLPEQASPAFINFIKQEKPLSLKLREAWLYELAEKKDWKNYDKYYQKSKDVNLRCYALIAAYHNGRQQAAMKSAESLWLSGRSQPKSCDVLFSLLLNQENFKEDLITKRIVLALKQRNLPLARYLLKKYKNPELNDAKLLYKIYLDPSNIKGLNKHKLHDDFYLYGLKRLVARNMVRAERYWQNIKSKKLLDEKQQQMFLSHIALYKAIRNHEDAYEWFNKVKPTYYTNVLLDWQVRCALKQHHWQRVLKLTTLHPDKSTMAWRYWQARALEATGQKQKAKAIFSSLSGHRNYYGFLSSIRLERKPNFKQEASVENMSTLADYKPFLAEVKKLYESGQQHEASLLLNDFTSELPKREASALSWWVANTLQWPGKSIYLTNLHKTLHNQLDLRFPTAEKRTIQTMAKKYNLPPEFIYAIIRQESAFRTKAVSRVGARGLMQLMPKTAKLIAKKKKIAYSDKSALFEQKKNIQLGTAYLDHLSQRFEGHLLLMAASYNAGPSQVNYWLKNHSEEAMDIWVDSLPWHETRNYLKNIVAFYLVYQYQLNKTPDISPFLRPFPKNH